MKKIIARIILLTFGVVALVALGMTFWLEPRLGAVFAGVVLFVWAIANALTRISNSRERS